MPELWLEVAEIVARSVLVSGSAVLFSSSWSILIGVWLASGETGWRNRLLDAFNALVAIPTVVVGLALYLIFSRQGPLGFLQLLYTPAAMILGQAILITPLLVSLTASTLRELRGRVWETAVALGATEGQARATLLSEGMPALITAVLVGFNRALGELGVALMLGGNIRGLTRVMTTSIALEVGRGEFELALALGGLLLAVSFMVTAAVRRVGGK